MPGNRTAADQETQPRGDADSSFALVKLACSGDERALNDLCALYLPRLQRWAHGRLPGWARDSLDTHDLVQDTLTHVARRIQNFEPRHEGAFQSYLRQALLNRVRDHIRRAHRHPAADPLDSGNVSPDPSPLERYEAALQRLKPSDRDAIILRVELGCPLTEVAEALGKPTPNAAYVAIRRAIVRLVKEMSHALPGGTT